MGKRKIGVCLCLWMLVQSMTAQQGSSAMPAWEGGRELPAEMVLHIDTAAYFTAETVPDAVFARMRGKSYPAGCTVPRNSLRYVKVLHVDLSGAVRMGEIVCNKRIAGDLVDIFRTLFRHRYPIQSIRLIDDFNGDDEQSMRANNTSSFCFRKVNGAARLSAHAHGMAIDINPLYNPYCRRLKSGAQKVQPGNAHAYCDRDAEFPYKIKRNDLLCRLFRRHGFRWGGAWNSVKDYQHFEKAADRPRRHRVGLRR